MLEILKKQLKNQQGNVLIIMASMVLMVIVIIGGAYLYLSSASRIGSTLHYERTKAYYIAEAGVEIAIDELLKGNTLIATPLAFAGGEIVDLTVNDKGNNVYKITSVGGFQDARRVLEVKIEIGDLIEVVFLENVEDIIYIDEDLKINNSNEDNYDGKNIYVNGKLDITSNVNITINDLYVKDGVDIKGNTNVIINNLYVKNDVSIDTTGVANVNIKELYVNGDVGITTNGNIKININELYLTGNLSTENKGNNNGEIIIGEVYELDVIDLIKKSGNLFKVSIVSWKEVYN